MNMDEFTRRFVEANANWNGPPLRGEHDRDEKDRFDVVEAWHCRLRGDLGECLHWLAKERRDEFDAIERAARRGEWARLDDLARGLERALPPCFAGLADDALKHYRSNPK